MMTSKTTVVVVDTHKPEMVLDENILNKANRKVVMIIIDVEKALFQIHYSFIWNLMQVQLQNLSQSY